MIEGKNRYEAIMVDIWSSGVILYAMLCGCLPFEDPETSKLYQKILAGEYKIPKTLSEDAKDMLSHILTVDPAKRFRIEDIRRHRWWNLTPPQTNSQGLIVGYHRIPIDDQILRATVELGFDHGFTRKCIEANRHNDATTTYYLLLKKFVRDGGISKAYLGSKHFDSALIEPLRKVTADCNVAPTQPSSPSTRLRRTSTHGRRRQWRRTATASRASGGRCTTWSTT
jgi:5'-AMP-activated protein kinase, catalytic alpha subunit